MIDAALRRHLDEHFHYTSTILDEVAIQGSDAQRHEARRLSLSLVSAHDAVLSSDADNAGACNRFMEISHAVSALATGVLTP